MHRRLFIRLALLVTSFFSASHCYVFGQSGTLRPPPGPVPDIYFGLHIHRADTGIAWPATRFGTWRLWDTFTAWAQLEPQRGTWNFDRLDKDVSLAEEHGVEVLLTLGLSPAWASVHPTEASGYGLGNAAEPKSIEDWHNYVAAVAKRYKGRVHAYEIWSDPNMPDCYTGSAEQMVRLAREAYETLKGIDPSVIVVSPPATATGGLAWLDEYFERGGGRYSDVIGFHLNVKPQAPENLIDLAAQVKRVMAKHHIDQPLWNTETGWVMTDLSQDQASAYVSRALVLGWAAGAARFYWYSWDNYKMGLFDPVANQVTPAAKAYDSTRNWLSGATMRECTSDSSGRWLVVIERAGGYEGRIIWQTGKTAPFKVPASWGVRRIHRLDGSKAALTSETISIGPAPLLLDNAPTESIGRPQN